MRAVLFLLAGATVAQAEPRFEVLDRGDAVEIVAHETKAMTTAIAPVRSRLEVPITSRPAIGKLVPANEKTVRVVELDGNTKPVLSVKLGFEHETVATLAKYAQAIQVGEDLHLIVPRALPAPGTTIALPEPTLPPELAAKLAPPASPLQPPAPKLAPKPEAKPAPKLEPKLEPKAPAPQAAPVVDKAKPIAKAPEGSPLQNLPALLAFALAAIGCVMWMKRKKRASTQPASSIDVVAQKSLGGKARIVWLRIGNRDMVVAVTPQSVCTLGQWLKSAERAPLPEAITAPAAAPPEASPAVAGLLKLRRTSQFATPVVDEVEADAAWAREIVAATGARS